MLMTSTFGSKVRTALKGKYAISLVATSFLLALKTVSLAQGSGPTVGGCPVFPSDSIWNTSVDNLPVNPRSKQYVASIGTDKNLHPGFASAVIDGAPIGIPFTVVPRKHPKVAIFFRSFGD